MQNRRGNWSQHIEIVFVSSRPPKVFELESLECWLLALAIMYAFSDAIFVPCSTEFLGQFSVRVYATTACQRLRPDNGPSIPNKPCRRPGRRDRDKSQCTRPFRDTYGRDDTVAIIIIIITIIIRAVDARRA